MVAHHRLHESPQIRLSHDDLREAADQVHDGLFDAPVHTLWRVLSHLGFILVQILHAEIEELMQVDGDSVCFEAFMLTNGGNQVNHGSFSGEQSVTHVLQLA